MDVAIGGSHARGRDCSESCSDLGNLGDRVLKGTLSGADSDGGTRYRLGMMHDRICVSSTSRRPGSIRRTGANLCGRTSARCATAATGDDPPDKHLLEEADALCDRIMIHEAGKDRRDGTPDELKRRILFSTFGLDLVHVRGRHCRACGGAVAQPRLSARCPLCRHAAAVTGERADQALPLSGVLRRRRVKSGR